MQNKRLGLTTLGVCLASFLTALDFAIVNTALPIIQNNLHTSTIELQWVMNITVLIISISLILFGRLADIYGRKRILLFDVITFGLTSLMAGLSTSISQLILWRAIQGIGSASIIPSSLALMTEVLPKPLHTKGFGIWTAINGIGFALGPVLGGIISQHVGWQWIFYINIPIALISCGLIQLANNPSLRSQKDGIDWLGFIALSIGIGAITLGVIQSPLWGWTSLKTLSSISLGMLSLGIFIPIEKRAASPLISLKLFIQSRYLSAVIANSLPVLFAYVIFFFLPLFLHQVKGLPIAYIGYIMLPTTLSMVVISPVTTTS